MVISDRKKEKRVGSAAEMILLKANFYISIENGLDSPMPFTFCKEKYTFYLEGVLIS